MIPEQPTSPFQNPEIIKRLLITFGCITVYLIGRNIPVPGFDSASIFALSVAPYIGAAVLLSLLRATGRFDALAGKDAVGRAGIYRVVRFIALPIAIGQAVVLTGALHAPLITATLAVAALTAGALFILWLAEEITDNGIGNGVLLILFIDLAAKAPGGIGAFNELVSNEDLAFSVACGIAVLIFLALFCAVKLETAQRMIPVQYAKRVVGRKMMGGQQTTVPIKVNPAGVLALIAAATVLSLLAALFAEVRLPSVYFPLFAGLVVFFSWLYRTTGVDPRELAGQIQQNGGFIVGTRGGDAMVQYFSKIVDKLSMSSALPVAAAAAIPAIAVHMTGSSLVLSAVSIYLLAGVALDVMSQVQTRAMMTNYAGKIPQPSGVKSGGGRPRSNKKRKRRR
jgi:preprotein translocase subunit SecY